MYHIDLTPRLEVLVLVLLLLVSIQLLRVAGRRGRVVLGVFLVVSAATNPGRGEHVRAIQRTFNTHDEEAVRARTERHDVLLGSVTTVDRRLVSVGWLGRVFVVPHAPQGLRPGDRRD